MAVHLNSLGSSLLLSSSPLSSLPSAIPVPSYVSVLLLSLMSFSVKVQRTATQLVDRIIRTCLTCSDTLLKEKANVFLAMLYETINESHNTNAPQPNKQTQETQGEKQRETGEERQVRLHSDDWKMSVLDLTASLALSHEPSLHHFLLSSPLVSYNVIL